MENSSIAREDSGAPENSCSRTVNQATGKSKISGLRLDNRYNFLYFSILKVGSSKPRKPLHDVSNIKAFAYPRQTENELRRATRAHDENLLSAMPSAVLQLTTGSIKDILTSSFILPCILCFLSIQASLFVANEGKLASSTVSATSSRQVSDREKSLYEALKEKEMLKPDYLRGFNRETVRGRTNLMNNLVRHLFCIFSSV